MVLRLLGDLIGLLVLTARSRRSIEAENLVLRRQLALFKERGVKPRRIDAATRLSLAWLSRLCDWRWCVIVVWPKTIVRWHRALATVLALQITTWTASHSAGTAAAHSTDGDRESSMG
jgi:hypothetical protein